MKYFIFFSLLFILINNLPIKPVIGIYGNSYPENGPENTTNGSYYPMSYVYWLESGGADVMAIHYWYSEEEINKILHKINGVLFLGGGRDFSQNQTWEKNAKYIIDQSMQMNLPFWGTCQGFQLIASLLSQNLSLLKNEFDDVNILHSLDINNSTKTSKMFQLFTQNDFDLLTHTNSTIYNHVWGFLPEDFLGNENLKNMTLVTSISQDHNGTKFIDSYEGINSDFFAVQFHPEKNPFKRANYFLEDNTESLKVSQKLVFNFVQISRKNGNKFGNDDRDKYDFFDTYNGTKNCEYNPKDECCYFYKNK